MNRSQVMLGIVGMSLMLSACQDKKNKTVDENITETDTLETSPGVPLDNIHRSRPADTLNDSNKNKEQGVPLDNLDRNKKGELN